MFCSGFIGTPVSMAASRFARARSPASRAKAPIMTVFMIGAVFEPNPYLKRYSIGIHAGHSKGAVYGVPGFIFPAIEQDQRTRPGALSHIHFTQQGKIQYDDGMGCLMSPRSTMGIIQPDKRGNSGPFSFHPERRKSLNIEPLFEIGVGQNF